MRALQEWGEKRFKPMVMLAHVTALSVKSCHETILLSRSKSLLSLMDTPAIKLDDWLALYRHPTAVRAFMLGVLLQPESVNQITAIDEQYNIAQREMRNRGERMLRECLTDPNAAAKGLRKSMRYWQHIYRRFHMPMVESMLNDNEPIPENFRDWLAVPEFFFFMTVVMPCWLEYYVTPWVLYRQACRGKFPAIESLLRLDPDIDKDHHLAEQIFRIRQQNSGQYKLLQQARYEGCKKMISLADVKFLLGGLLMKWSKELQAILQGELHFEILQQFTPAEKQAALRLWIKQTRQLAARTLVKCRLKAPDIKALFDAIAKDTDKGLGDPDFRQQPNAIYKRLIRNAGAWPKLRKADKTRAA